MNNLRRHNKLLLFFGIFCCIFWLLDFTHTVIFLHRSSWMFSYSSLGLLLVSIALVTENKRLVYTGFCALFFMESVFDIDFLYHILIQKSLFGLSNYAFVTGFSRVEFFLTLYHFLIPTGLILGIMKVKGVYKYGWVGALLFSGFVILLTYLFVNHTDNINCLYHAPDCVSRFPFAYKVSDFVRIASSFVVATVFVYIPSNLIVIWIKEKL